jgi:transposase
VVSYLGLNPREFSSGGRQRLGVISKQGNTMMRWLLVETSSAAGSSDAPWSDERKDPGKEKRRSHPRLSRWGVS